MGKINLLTTGLAMMCTETFGISNIDITWLVKNPSTILWADSIFLTKYMEESLSRRDNCPFGKGLNLIFENLEENDIVKFKNSKNVFNDNVSEKLDEKITEDLTQLQKDNQLNIRIDEHCDEPDNIFIDEKPYCFPELRSIYASLLISEKWDAKCLFSDRSLNFLKYKISSSSFLEFHSTSNSFDNIFSLHLPDLPLLPNCYSLNSSSRCIKKEGSELDYLSNIESNLATYLDLREYDEINQIKDVIFDINKKINSEENLCDSDLLLKEYQEIRSQTHKTMHTWFPKIRKWSNYSMLVCPLATTYGFLTGSSLLTGIGIAMAASNQLVEFSLNHIENKNKWVGFKVENELKKF